ncbi:YopX family protein [Listeria monocytogenes]|nr:hypothetical protein [Listeria monocytogenes]
MKIEFRGKRLRSSEWVHGFYYEERGFSYITVVTDKPGEIPTHLNVPVRPKTVGQYTNVDTPDGKKIFEDDYVLVKDCHPTGHDDFYGVVEFLEGAWWVDNELMQKAVLLWNESNEIEILGNIHDNPELLEVPE